MRIKTSKGKWAVVVYAFLALTNAGAEEEISSTPETAWFDTPTDGGISAASQETDTLTLSSAYFEKLYTNKGLVTFGLELARFSIRVEDYWQFESLWAKWGWRALSFWFSWAFNVAYHETGHGLRARAYGYDYQLLTDMKDNSPYSKDENFFKYFLHSLVNTKRAANRASDEFGKKHTDVVLFLETGAGMTLQEAKDFTKVALIFSAGGMNNNTYLAEATSDGLYRRDEIPFLEGMTYAGNQLISAQYAREAKERGDDPYDVELHWKTLGVSATKTDMQRAGVLSFFLSGTTYRMIYAVWNELLHTGRQARPFSVYGFRVPDVFSYTTSKGMSYKLVSEYKVRDNIHVFFGGERVFHGESATEFNVGFEHELGESWRNMSYKCALTFGKGFDAEASVKLPILERLIATIGGAIYSRDSLLGERHATDLRKKYSGTVYASVSIKY
ncbi:MAG: hypothetical protein LBD15_00530 [Holosporales bacterium]|jgi:hypothetical protein|nr:hypothetical protein [Holosporales bacterium]